MPSVPVDSSRRRTRLLDQATSGASFPAKALLAADAGAFLALGGLDVRAACILVPPAQVGVQGPGLDRVVRMMRVGQGELPQWPEASRAAGPSVDGRLGATFRWFGVST